MHSIRTRITILTTIAILVSVLAIGGISISSIKQEGDLHSAEEMKLICENSKYSIDQYLDSIEQSVNMLTRYTLEDLDSVMLLNAGVIGATGMGDSLEGRTTDPEGMADLDEYLRSHAQRVESAFQSVANHTNGVLTYYYRVNPELTADACGFFYSREGNSSFIRVPLTPLSEYDPEDITHVGWYYLPISQGRPTWMEPYLNANLDEKIVSYVCPVYKAGTFIGVVGMDIDYSTLVEQIERIQLYRTGCACLANENGTLIYHPTLESGAPIAGLCPDLSEVSKLMRYQDSSTAPIHYTWDGVHKTMAFTTLSNGLKLMVMVPDQEINERWTQLINITLAAALLILVFFVPVTALTMKRLTEPLTRLTLAAQRLAEGDYETNLEYDRDDEVGILTKSFQQLVNHLQVYISDLNSKVYKDALTGVKNKGGFDISARKLNDTLRIKGQAFGIVMLDCNYLKNINDLYGHEKGDLYLQTACRLICQVFAHSPVFRVGGDEFTVLLQGADYESRDGLLKEFDRQAEAINREASGPWFRADIAKGMAVYQAGDTVESVLKRADEQMYREKKRMKEGA